MELKFSQRESTKKSENKRARREGRIPAILYSKGEKGESIFVDQAGYDTILRGISKGHLPTTLFELTDESGQVRKALVKDVHYHRTTYAVEHIDFEEIHDDLPLNVNVPIICTGSSKCVGIKEGGVLRQVIRHMRVRCLYSKLPESFELKIEDLNLKESKRLSDISIPEGVKPLANMQEVAAAIVKR